MNIVRNRGSFSMRLTSVLTPRSLVSTETIATLGFLESSTSVETAKEVRAFEIKTKGFIKPTLKIMLKMLISLFMPILLNAL